MALTLESWFVLWHPKGAFRTQSVREHIAMNRQKCLAGDGDGYFVVGLAGTMEEAAQMERELKKERAARRADGGGIKARTVNGAGEAIAAQDLVSACEDSQDLVSSSEDQLERE